jgi:cobyric acid synthase
VNARMLMVQGCTSDAGKSALVGALGGESGRAQAAQAMACRILKISKGSGG